jgi:hypothetical protein
MLEHPIYFNLVDQFHQQVQQELVLVAVEYYLELVALVEWEIMEQVQVVVLAALVVVVVDFSFHATEVILLLQEAQVDQLIVLVVMEVLVLLMVVVVVVVGEPLEEEIQLLHSWAEQAVKLST